MSPKTINDAIGVLKNIHKYAVNNKINVGYSTNIKKIPIQKRIKGF